MRLPIRAILFLFVLWAASCMAAADEPAESAEVKPAIDFARDIRPIFAQYCYDCHGPDAQEGGLRLHQRAAATAGGDSGQKAIVPGNPKASRLLAVIDGSDVDLQMPPEGEALSAEQIDRITRWITAGAPWPAEADVATEESTHWAWQPPQRAALPVVESSTWPRHPIDFFVVARLEAEGLTPSPEADRYTLARRVYLDLVGLPPSAEQVARFVSDRRADAYERFVDEALADPGFGERWARVWLDLARYADSKGYGSDPLRTIWRYRDWVIQAFNRNLPFDQFTIEQLAGDLLPQPTTDQLLATAFHRNTMANDEGGTDDEEFRVAAVKDRIETTMQVWMGLSFGCAKCHSHKFDPITQREYYQGYAIFNQTADADRGDESPTMKFPTREEQERIARQKRLLSAVDQPGGTGAAGAGLEMLAIEFRKQVEDLENQVAAIPVMRALPADQRRETHTMVKGNFQLQGDKVDPALPAAFHPLSDGASPDRLGLARWLVDANNPLAARVTVNRFWSRLFGRGLVSTEEDFGTQGLPPTHPELLDWLAVEFMKNGWDVKDLLRQIVCTATYRQSSTPSPEVLAQDPNNELLAAGPRFRLEAEMVRDQALAIAGLLSRKQGGPSVYPPQPPGLWRAAFNGQRNWDTSTGEDRYRRGLYTYWRRTVPYPSMATFDAPSREICTLRRVPTNTPLQAFVTLNDPVFVESAQAFARRIEREGGATVESRCSFALQSALLRPPSREQMAVLAELFQSELTHYRQDTAAAVEIATDPLGPLPEGADAAELAAWTVVANVVLNLDGVLTKR